MSNESNSHKTQIIVALIGLAGVLGAGLLTNWEKIFPSAKEPTPILPTPVVTTDNNNPPADTRLIVTPPSNQPGPAVSPITQDPQPQNFSGTYLGISTEGMVQSQFQMTFQRHGNTVTGTYIQNGAQGTIQGTVDGDTMHYQWNLGWYSGRGQCMIQGNKTVGTWGYGTSTTNGGTTVAYLQ